MKKIIALMCAALMAAIWAVAPSPVAADHNVSPGHWPSYRFGTTTPPIPGWRAFWVFDVSGSSEVEAVLRQVIDEYVYIPEIYNAGGQIPLPMYYRAAPGSIPCNENWDPSGIASFATVCFAGDVGDGFAHVHLAGAHYTQYHPSLHISQSAWNAADWNFKLKAMRHELGHVLGLQHSSDCGSLMASPEKGCGRGQFADFWTAHDIAALQNFYLPHPWD